MNLSAIQFCLLSITPNFKKHIISNVTKIVLSMIKSNAFDKLIKI